MTGSNSSPTIRCEVYVFGGGSQREPSSSATMIHGFRTAATARARRALSYRFRLPPPSLRTRGRRRSRSTVMPTSARPVRGAGGVQRHSRRAFGVFTSSSGGRRLRARARRGAHPLVVHVCPGQGERLADPEPGEGEQDEEDVVARVLRLRRLEEPFAFAVVEPSRLLRRRGFGSSRLSSFSSGDRTITSSRIATANPSRITCTIFVPVQPEMRHRP